MKINSHSLVSLTLYSCVFASLTASCAAPARTVAPVRVAQNADTPATAATSAVSVKLAQDGRALLPIVISADASPETKKMAATLADYLKRISGGEFKVETGALSADAPGISLGLASQFGAAMKDLQSDDPTKSEDYVLRSHANGLVMAGASEMAVGHAVWDLLYRLGYRQFFPGKTWEIVPTEKNLSVALNASEHPDYNSRAISPGYGILRENRDDYAAWRERNRLLSGINLRTGHSYRGIVARNLAEFEKHPEYLTQPSDNLLKGQPKFCVSNAGLRQLVIDDALKQFAADPSLQSISLDPSDTGGWESETCDDDKKIGSIIRPRDHPGQRGRRSR